jgi:mercuric ion binding protein
MKNHIKTISLLIIILSVNPLFASNGQIKKESFKVSGNCEMCKKKIEESIKVEGVEAAQWNPDTKLMKVKYDADKITIGKIHQLIAAAGYDTDKVKANDPAYYGLTKCCQYRSTNK